MFARQLDKHTVGYVTYKGGLQSSMSTTVMRETENSRMLITIQVTALNQSSMTRISENEMNFQIPPCNIWHLTILNISLEIFPKKMH